MNAKETLNQYRVLYGKARRYEIRIERLEDSLTKAVEWDGSPRSTTPGNPTEQNALKLVELSEKLKAIKIECELQAQLIADKIEKVKDPRYKELLFSRYIMLLPWEDVAVRVTLACRPYKDYDEKHIQSYMHARALKEFEEVMKGD